MEKTITNVSVQTKGVRMKKRVLIILADGFEEIEAITPIDLMRRAGLDVLIAGLSKREIKGAHGITIACDTTVAEIHLQPFDAVVLPGGFPGTSNLLNSDMVLEIVRNNYRENSVTAAICAAPQILDKSGVLNNKPFTCYPSVQEQISHGTFTNEPVVISGNVITGRAAGSSIEFGLSIIASLLGQNSADEVKQKIVF